MMPARQSRRHYQGEAGDWEAKLGRVMDRIQADEYRWDYSRSGAWVRWTLNGQHYGLEQSVDKAAARKVSLYNGVDCLAQLILTLEDLARMAERGIYEMSTFMAGFKALPAPRPVAEPFMRLQFTEPPTSVEAVRVRYRQLARVLHPDAGGDPRAFQQLVEAARQAEALILGGEQR